MQEEPQNEAPYDGEGTQDVEDQLPSWSGMLLKKENEPGYKAARRTTHIAHLRDSCCHQRSDHTSPTDGAVPDSLSQGHFRSGVPETSHEGQSWGDGGLEYTEDEARNEDTSVVSVENHSDNSETEGLHAMSSRGSRSIAEYSPPDQSGNTQDTSCRVSADQVRPRSLRYHMIEVISDS